MATSAEPPGWAEHFPDEALVPPCSAAAFSSVLCEPGEARLPLHSWLGRLSCASRFITRKFSSTRREHHRRSFLPLPSSSQQLLPRFCLRLTCDVRISTDALSTMLCDPSPPQKRPAIRVSTSTRRRSLAFHRHDVKILQASAGCPVPELLLRHSSSPSWHQIYSLLVAPVTKCRKIAEICHFSSEG